MNETPTPAPNRRTLLKGADLIIGYARGYRASWETCLGELTANVLLDNTSAWSADHCADALEVPGVLYCNKRIHSTDPALIDIAPSILAEFGLPTPNTMTGTNVFQNLTLELELRNGES